MDDLNELKWFSSPEKSVIPTTNNPPSNLLPRSTLFPSRTPTETFKNASSSDDTKETPSSHSIFRYQAKNFNSPVFKRFDESDLKSSDPTPLPTMQSRAYASSSSINPASATFPSSFTSTNPNLPPIKHRDLFEHLVSFEGNSKPSKNVKISLNNERHMGYQPQKLNSSTENPLKESQSENKDHEAILQDTIEKKKIFQINTTGADIVPSTNLISGSMKGKSQKLENDVFGDILGSLKNKTTPEHSLNYLRSQPIVESPSLNTHNFWNLDFLSEKKAQSTMEPSIGPDMSLIDFGMPESELQTKLVPSVNVIESQDKHPLGILANPVSYFRPENPTPPAKPMRSSRHQSRADPDNVAIERTSRPKVNTLTDKYIAQIVDMGFTAIQAQTALAATQTGQDLKAAIEILIYQKEAEEQVFANRNVNKSSIVSGRRRTNTGDYKRHYDGDSSEGGLTSTRHSYVKNNNLEVPKYRTYGKSSSDGEGSDRSTSSASSFSGQNFQQQKEKLISSASELGMSAFKKANAIYQQSKHKVKEALEEFQQSTPGDGRPKWMQDANFLDSDEDDSEKNEIFIAESNHVKFQDVYHDSSDEEADSSVSNPRLGPLSKSISGKNTDERFKDQSFERFEEKKHTISKDYGLQEPVYTSSARRKPIISQYDFLDSSHVASNSPIKPAEESPEFIPAHINIIPAKSSLPPRPVIQVPLENMRAYKGNKEKGNKLFRLGQFVEAEKYYSLAISSLPTQHLNLVILYNNRAATKLKNGDYPGCVQDSSLALRLIDDYTLPPPPGVDIDLKEQYSKALQRRGSAFEGMEKYDHAKDDYEKLLKAFPNGNHNVNDGLRRCRKVLGMVSTTNLDKRFSQPATSLQHGQSSIKQSFSLSTFGAPLNAFGFVDPINKSSRTIQSNLSSLSSQPNHNSPAVSNLRNKARQQEIEDAEKLRYKDQVDQKILLWKGGKETNLRALLSSLNIVLWNSLVWKDIGLHELVTPAQVKLRYMKAIGKVHPDKLSSTTTIEQKLVANAVFSTLNYAWDFRNRGLLLENTMHSHMAFEVLTSNAADYYVKSLPGLPDRINLRQHAG
ncbi:hypothetical protein G9A89_008885 [Geosiphon pyriformis]|nr:hypothetical protein G9A89_008885 [Geosiphon pyriformis]